VGAGDGLAAPPPPTRLWIAWVSGSLAALGPHQIWRLTFESRGSRLVAGVTPSLWNVSVPQAM
jgi:hypothetical protein